MIGRAPGGGSSHTRDARAGANCFAWRDSQSGDFEDVSFGVAGRRCWDSPVWWGRRRTELVEAIFGYGPRDAGKSGSMAGLCKSKSVRMRFAMASRSCPTTARARAGRACFVASTSDLQAIIVCCYDRCGSGIGAEQAVRDVRIGLRVWTSRSPRERRQSTEGGSRQWLLAGARIYVFDGPRAGIDVGAKAVDHRLIHGLAADGAGVVVVSSEIEEILAVADRIVVMHRGKIAGEMTEQRHRGRIVELALEADRCESENSARLGQCWPWLDMSAFHGVSDHFLPSISDERLPAIGSHTLLALGQLLVS